MKYRKTNRSSVRPEFGFSLIELMIGMVIGIIGLLVVNQMFAVWGARTQTTTSGSDAQVSGTLASYLLERDLTQAGLGFGNAPQSIMGCTVKGKDPSNNSITFRLAPVEITSGALGASQKISALHGDSSFFVTGYAFQSSTATTKVSSKGYGFQLGHFIVIAGGSVATCGSGTPQTLAFTKIISPILVVAPNVTLTTNDDADLLAGTPFGAGMLYDLGAGPQRNLWEVDPTTPGRPVLRWSNTLLSATTFMEAAEGVVNLQAQYGYDANGNNMIDETEWTATLPGLTDWTRIRAIRVSLLVRSKKFEQSPVTTIAPLPSWSSCDASKLGCSFLMTDIGGVADTNPPNNPANWRHYRYRVYEKVIPLLNMIYGTQS